MAVILNIETSNTYCSVALTAEGMILRHLENTGDRNHAATLSTFVKSMLDFAGEKEIKPEAVSVSLGPGSYTGLRIGLSEAKGLAYGFDIPLIGLSTLEIMAAGVMFSHDDISTDGILVPMLDARRMEVYTAAYDFSFNELIKPRALILDGDDSCYRELIGEGRTVVFFGSGMPKWREKMGAELPANVRFIDNVEPLATDMTALSELAYMRRDFIDTAYSTPLYLKDFQATKPRNRVLGQQADETERIKKNC